MWEMEVHVQRLEVMVAEYVMARRLGKCIEETGQRFDGCQTCLLVRYFSIAGRDENDREVHGGLWWLRCSERGAPRYENIMQLNN